jgi:hypothetical protein
VECQPTKPPRVEDNFFSVEASTTSVFNWNLQNAIIT